jgi:histidinol-phosphate aminotransferase
MSLVSALLREDLRDFAGYRSARSELADGQIWLNANESAHLNAADVGQDLRRYPQPQPQDLRAAVAALYGCTVEQLLIGRGSDEPIDLLVRAFCTPARDAVLVTPPVFGMYAVCARLQGARLLEVPLQDGEDDFRVDLAEVARVALAQHARLVFLCSPGNPAGGVLMVTQVLDLARKLEGHALLVVDEAYIEYADAPSLVCRITSQPNLAVLRTLSKAHALAGVRIGSLIADPEVIAILRRCQAPYPIPVPCAMQALHALSKDALVETRSNVAVTCIRRDALLQSLQAMPTLHRIYPSETNFILARCVNPAGAFQSLLNDGIVVRDMRMHPQLNDALRITVGTAEENARVISALESRVAA